MVLVLLGELSCRDNLGARPQPQLKKVFKTFEENTINKTKKYPAPTSIVAKKKVITNIYSLLRQSAPTFSEPLIETILNLLGCNNNAHLIKRAFHTFAWLK